MSGDRASIALALDLLLPPSRQCARARFSDQMGHPAVSTPHGRKRFQAPELGKQRARPFGTKPWGLNAIVFEFESWRHCSITTALKMAPVRRLRAPSRTCAVATLEALLFPTV